MGSRAALEALERRLHAYRAHALEDLPKSLASVLESERAAVVFYSRSVKGVKADRVFCHGFVQSELQRRLNELLARPERDFPTFDPLRPAKSERNRAVALRSRMGEEQFRAMSIHRDVLAPLGAGDCDHVRALVCGDDNLIAWVGAMRPEPYTKLEVGRLQRLIPALQKRLELERGWGWCDRALRATLDFVPQPAFVLRSDGVILELNELARRLLATDCVTVTADLDAALAGSRDRFDLKCVELPDCAPCFLAVARGQPGRCEEVARAAHRWGLTERQREVLELLAKGHSNKLIGAELGCAEATVEVHVRAIMERSESGNRASVIAKLFAQFAPAAPPRDGTSGPE
jgi:DNA-binding CsgD family transcriptional regulator